MNAAVAVRQADVKPDLAAMGSRRDFNILVRNVAGLTASDFIL